MAVGSIATGHTLTPRVMSGAGRGKRLMPEYLRGRQHPKFGRRVRARRRVRGIRGRSRADQSFLSMAGETVGEGAREVISRAFKAMKFRKSTK